jgi:hypothetical protein
VRQQQRRHQRGDQHPALPAERHIGAGARAQPRRPRLGDQRHADAELAAESEPGDGAVDEKIAVAPGQRAQAGEDRKQQDRPGEHAHAAVIVAQYAEHDAADHRADQRPGEQRAALRRRKREVGADRSQHEAEDEKVEAVHGIAGHGGGERLLRFRVGPVDDRGARSGCHILLRDGHDGPRPCSLFGASISKIRRVGKAREAAVLTRVIARSRAAATKQSRAACTSPWIASSLRSSQ